MKVLNILVRRCVLITRFEETVSFYENLIAQTARLRFDYPEYDLKLAQVGSVLLIGGTEQSLAPFAPPRPLSWSTTLPPGRNICLPPEQRLSIR